MYQHKKVSQPVSARKPVKKKPKDKPKRPLSAYNFFFKEERVKIVQVVMGEEGANSNSKEPDPVLTDELISKLRKEGGKVSFEEMGKLIGRRWKSIGAEQMEYYEKLAGGDTERYKKEMEKYNEKKEEIREKNKRSADIHYASISQAHQMPPSMMRYSEMPVSNPGMYGAHMGYVPPYHMDQNAPHGYGQMPMMGAYNPYYMPVPPPNAEGQPGNGGPQPNQGDMSSAYAHASGNYHHNGPPPQNSGFQQPNEYSYLPDVPNSLQSHSSQQAQSHALEPDTNISSYPQQSDNTNNQDESW